MAMKKTFCIAILTVFAVVSGCSRNPEAAKKKYFDKGEAYFQANKYREAAIEYQNAIQIDPKYAQAHYELAQCFLKQNEWSLAFQELRRTIALDPTNWKAQVDLGSLLLAGGKYAEAAERAQAILAGDPQNAAAEMLQADADAAQGDLAKGLEEANRAVQMDPQRKESYVNLALIQEKKKDLAAAEKSFQQAIAMDPKYLTAMMGLAALYEREGRWPNAETQYQAAIAADPKSPLPRGALALCYVSQGKKDVAEQTLKDTKVALKDNPYGYRMLGDFYIGQRQMDKASAEFASLHSEHPQDVGVSKAYAQLLIDTNKLDDASRITDDLLKNAPGDGEALILHGEILNKEGKGADAVAPLEKAVKAAPNNAAGHYHLGLAYAAASNLPQAETEWREAARLQPRMVDAQRALAGAALQTGDMKTLGEASQKWIEIDPRSSDAYVLHARSLAVAKDWGGAEAELNKAIELNPKNAAAFALLGDLRVAQKRFDDAERFYTQALGFNASAIEPITGLVNIDLVVRKQPAKAVARVEAQIARVPDRASLYVLLGIAERQNQNLPKSEEAFQKAVSLDKNNITDVLLLADVQDAQGASDRALSTYQQAIQAHPREARLYAALGRFYESKEKVQEAEDAYRKALDIQPENALAANNLAYLMLEHGGDVSAAMKLAEIARRGLPTSPNSADTLGWAYYRFGAYDSAINSLREAVKTDPKNPTYHYHLGMAYKGADNLSAAKKELEFTLKLNPHYAAAADIRKALAETNTKN